MASYQDFKNQYLGTAHDVDGYYGSQCWDGYAFYCKWLGYPYANCTSTGFVLDIWTNRASNGMLNNFVEFPIAELQSGDVVVFQKAGETPYSHIAIFDSWDGSRVKVMGQNQSNSSITNATSGFTVVSLSASSLYPTAFRPKSMVAQEETQTEEEIDMITISAQGRGIALISGGKFFAFLDANDPTAAWSAGIKHVQLDTKTFDLWQGDAQKSTLSDETVNKLLGK